ncbi:MAG: PAS domain-containing protein [Opitutaceae bacterium]|nr:PAS domain-containing protein [Opitutaceae bacterium]
MAGVLFAIGVALIAMGWVLRVVITALRPDVSAESLGWTIVIVGLTAAGVAFASARAWQRAAERRTARSEGLLAERADLAVITTDSAGDVVSLSSAAERILGCQRVDVIGKMIVEWVHAGDETQLRLVARAHRAAANAARDLGALVAAGSPLGSEREWVFVQADAGRVPVRGSISAMQHRGGREGYLIVARDVSAERQARQGRDDAELRLAKLGAHVPGMIFALRRNADGKWTLPYASDGIRHLFRQSCESVRDDASGLWNAVHPEDADRVTASLEQSAATLTPWECEYRVRFPDETVLWLRSTATAESHTDGAVIWHGFTTDVTDRKRAEQAHEEGRVLLQSVFSSVDLGVFVIEVTSGGGFRYAEINPAYERLTGLSAAEIRGRSPRDLAPIITEELAESLCASFRRGTESRGPLEYEEMFNARGRSLWLLTRLTPLRDPAGNVVRLVGRSLDITERKAIEFRFQSLTERLQLATEAAQVGIWDHDIVQDRIMWDSRMHTLYGVAPRDFNASFSAWSERVHPDDRARVATEHACATEGKGAFNTSFRIVRPDGQERQIRARAHVQRNSAGRATRMVGVNWDVTAERRAQAEIEKARDQAEDLNRQLENALDRAQRLAQEAAAATVAKSEFLANMSHEIRTPLNAVLGMSSVLLGTALSAEQREYAETIRSSGDGLLELLNGILDYSKIESGHLDLETRPFDLRECVESAMDVLAARAAEKHIDLLCELAPGVPDSIGGDDTRLRQVFVNLLSNAVKFTSHGQVLLAVDCVQRDGEEVRLRFAVRDSGIGIPEDRMNRLFKSFSQVDASTTRQYGGTGLGLAICKRIVELMGGRIWVESVVGQGSTFIFEIEAAAVVENEKPFVTTSSPVFSGRRVLVVDDNSESRRILCAQFASWGLVARGVDSGPGALEALGDGTPCDLVVMETDLPLMTGQEVLRRIRLKHSPAHLPVAMLVRPGQARGAVELGVAAYVSKPIKAATLLETVVAIFHGRTAQPAESASEEAPLGARHPLSVLLAEDNPVNQRVATLLLQRMGYRADVAANGREAIDAIARRRYDLVLMDVQMPEMDGLQATREICSRLTPVQRPRIVAMTANASTSDRDECLGAGMDGFLSKPVRQADLRLALEATPARSAAEQTSISGSTAA